MNRTLKTFLCLLLVFAMLPVPVRAADAFAVGVGISQSTDGFVPGDQITVTLTVSGVESADYVEVSYTVPEQLELDIAESKWLGTEFVSWKITPEKTVVDLGDPRAVSGEVLKLVFQVKETAEAGMVAVAVDVLVKNGEETLIENSVKPPSVEIRVPCAHAFAESWTADAENHWHKCENCDAAADKTAHEFQWVIDREATAEADGIKHEACTACGYKRNENTPHHVHRMTKTEAKKSTCTEGGSNAYYTCALCQKVYKDEAGTTETTVEAEALPLADHTGGTATCTAQAVCEVCGKGYGDMASHDYNEAWTADADSHWHKCVNCDATSTKTAHVFEWVIDKEATAEETGLKHEACTTCGYKRSENTIIDIAVHEHTMVKTPSKDATCEEAGNIAYWSCETCGGIYADKDGSIETTLEKVTVEATGHAYDDGKVTTEPTATEDGVRTFTCENCGATRTEVIPALGEEEDPTEPTEPEDTVDVIRIAGDNRCKTAFAAADKLKEVLGIEKFDAIILASGDNFADALAGSYLAAVKKAPILLYRKNTEAINSDYIAENLASGGTVYILGGTAAVPKTMADALEGVNVQRLAGDNRYETNLKILEAAGVEGDEILVATGMDFADCLAASATGLPILMVNSRLNNLTSGQKEFLEANSGKNITVIGGEAAVSKALLEKLEDYCYVERIQGARREETSLNVAKAFCGEASTVVIAYSRNFPDALCGGPLAYALKCPLLLVNKNNESYAAEYAADQTLTSAYVLGGTAALSDATVNKVFAD